MIIVPDVDSLAFSFVLEGLKMYSQSILTQPGKPGGEYQPRNIRQAIFWRELLTALCHSHAFVHMLVLGGLLQLNTTPPVFVRIMYFSFDLIVRDHTYLTIAKDCDFLTLPHFSVFLSYFYGTELVQILV